MYPRSWRSNSSNAYAPSSRVIAAPPASANFAARPIPPRRPRQLPWPAGPVCAASRRMHPASCWRRRHPAPAIPAARPPTRTNRTSPGPRLGSLVQAPRAVHLGRPVAVDQLVGDVRQRGILDHRSRVQHTTQRKAGGGRRRQQTPGGVSLSDVTALHHHIGPNRTDAFDCLEHLYRGLERELSTIRPAPAAAILSARNSPRPPKPPVIM